MFKRQIEKAYKELFGSRCDDPRYKHYFTYIDFPPMKEEAISFISQDNNTLRGGLYYDKESRDDYDKLVIFCHGMGGGYLAYMSEINMLVKNGFLVLAYDYTGTFSSDGESLKGFTLPLLDLKYCHKFIKENERLKNKELMIIAFLKPITLLVPRNINPLCTNSSHIAGKIATVKTPIKNFGKVS